MTLSLENKSIVLGVCGGIAAYKSVELLRLMVKQGASVRVAMTGNAGYFVGPTTFQALSGQAVCSTLFDAGEASIRHIDWAQSADLVVVAPATANIVGKMANGLADDALSTLLTAVTCPVMICPSMNTHMYESAAVQRNLKALEKDGVWIMAPGAGNLACGTTGPGRLPEPWEILDRVIHLLSPKDLAGKRVLVTAGPTREPVDPVRFISNPSSGKMGYAIARAAEYRGAEVVLVSGPTALEAPLNVNKISVETAAEMADAVFAHLPASDIIIKTAAVSDFRPSSTADHKIKKEEAALSIPLERTVDILKAVGEKKQNRFLVGFAAETHELAKNAGKKLAEKNLDMIVGNIVGTSDSGFGTDTNTVTLFFKDGSTESLETMDKAALAHVLLDRVVRCVK